MTTKIAYQGVAGAYSEQACKSAYPHLTPIACETFLDAMKMVEEGKAIYAMIPLENSTAGRVEEIYRLIPKMKLHVVGEHFEPVIHCLLGVKGSKIEDLKYVASHPQALAQCQNNILKLGLTSIAKLDTAGSAKEIKELNDKSFGAIASKLASKIYDLELLQEHFEDVRGNTTRFFILSKDKSIPPFEKDKNYITSIIFQVRDIPAALYKALGGFATNSINLLKLESYAGEGSLNASGFHVDIEGHIESKCMKRALEELEFFSSEVKILGTYESHRLRGKLGYDNSN
jgi:prephenate dehydratase